MISDGHHQNWRQSTTSLMTLTPWRIRGVRGDVGEDRPALLGAQQRAISAAIDDLAICFDLHQKANTGRHMLEYELLALGSLRLPESLSVG